MGTTPASPYTGLSGRSKKVHLGKTNIDLSMGYYAFELDEERKPIFTIVVPWGLYKYQVLPMGLKIGTAVFQGELISLFMGDPMS